jgi:hypothetical protein
MATAAQTVQIGHLDSETREIIDLIDSYALPADFFHWLSNGSFTQKLMTEKLQTDRYTRMGQFYVQSSLVFTGRSDYNLSKLPKDMVQFLTSKKTPMSSNMPESLNLKKEVASRICTDLYYTVISQFINKDENVGFSWEVYELPEIVKIYDNLNDPLRHWRKY